MERTIPGIRSILYTATPALLRVQVRTRPCQGLSCRRACCLVLPAIRHTTTGGTAMCTDPSCPVQRSFGSPGGGGIVTDRLRCCALRRRRFSRSFAASLSRRRSAGVAALPLPVDRASLFMASLPSDSPPRDGASSAPAFSAQCPQHLHPGAHPCRDTARDRGAETARCRGANNLLAPDKCLWH